jgi:hypothetical protein
MFGIVYSEKFRDTVSLVDIDQRPDSGPEFSGEVFCRGQIDAILHE